MVGPKCYPGDPSNGRLCLNRLLQATPTICFARVATAVYSRSAALGLNIGHGARLALLLLRLLKIGRVCENMLVFRSFEAMHPVRHLLTPRYLHHHPPHENDPLRNDAQ